MSDVQPLSPVRIGGTDVYYAPGIKAGNWVFLTGHEATDYETGLAPEVRGKPGLPLHGLPKNRREGNFILERFRRLLGEAGTDLAHGVRLDQYYPTWKAVDPYHLARKQYFGEYIPPSTSVLMKELLVGGAEITSSLLAVMPGGGRDPRRFDPRAVDAPPTSGFAPAVRSGDFIFVAGQMANNGSDPLDPRARVPAHALWAGYEIRRQAEFVITERLAPALAATGSSLAHSVKAQAYLQHVEDFPHFMDVWNAHFKGVPCALSLVPTAGFGVVDGILEINLLALAADGSTRAEPVGTDVPSPMAYGPPAVRAGDLLLFSALMAVDENGAAPGVVESADLARFGAGARAQMRYILGQADRLCRAAGTSLENVVRVHQFHTDLDEFYATHRVWQEVLPGRPIPFTAVGVPGPLPAPGCTVLVDLWVYAP